eukprot:scaffold766_cov343-Pavlova_lutheri.AAC.23
MVPTVFHRGNVAQGRQLRRGGVDPRRLIVREGIHVRVQSYPCSPLVTIPQRIGSFPSLPMAPSRTWVLH